MTPGIANAKQFLPSSLAPQEMLPDHLGLAIQVRAI
jgi:hypothetical protein